MIVQAHAVQSAAPAILSRGSPPLSGLKCSPDDGAPILSAEELLRQAEARDTLRAVAQELARTLVYFTGQVLHVDELYRRRNRVEHRVWARREEARVTKALLGMRGGGGGDAAKAYRSTRATFEEWGIETRFEVLAAAGSLMPLGLMKLRVLSRRGEAFLVIVDYLCRSPSAGREAGPVGSALLRCAVASFPGCRVVLCIVRPAVPAHFAQTHADQEAAARFYANHGFAPAGDDLLALLHWLASGRPGRAAPPPGDGETLLALAQEEGLLDSLPVLQCHTASRDRPITWLEHAGGDGVESDRVGPWRRGTDPTAAVTGGVTVGEMCWLAPWMREGAAVEVESGGIWWNAKLLSVREGLVHVFYVGGLVAEVVSPPTQPHRPLFLKLKFARQAWETRGVQLPVSC